MRRLIACALLAFGAVNAQAASLDHLLHPAPGITLRRVILVMRHGVRPPLNGQVPAGAALVGGWPPWAEPPGDLTPHGAQALSAVGRYDRTLLEQGGLLPSVICPPARDVSVRANSAERTIASATAFLDGFAPGCGLQSLHRPLGVPDPVFAPLDADAARFDMTRIVPRLPDAQAMFARQAGATAILDRIVSCDGHSCPFFSVPAGVAVDKSGHQLQLSGPIAEGSSIAEALMLAWLDGKPSPAGLDAAALAHLSGLHAAMLATIVGAPAIAEPLSRDLAALLRADLQGEGPAFRVYIGHDDTIAPLLTRLGMSIAVPGFARGDVPVGSALGIALYRQANGVQLARLFIQSQSADGIRYSRAPQLFFPQVRGCEVGGGLCPVSVVGRRLER